MNVLLEGNYHLIWATFDNGKIRVKGKEKMEQEGYFVFREYLSDQEKVVVIFAKELE